MGKVVILFVLFLFSCGKQDGVMMKYAYITKDNIEYKSERGYEMVTTHLCPYESRLSSREVVVEQDRRRCWWRQVVSWFWRILWLVLM